jgi:hypothetical protein
MTPEQEIRELSGECALLLRTLDRVRRAVYDRLGSDEAGRVILDIVNGAYNQVRPSDGRLVEDAIRRHAVIMLMNMDAAKKPLPGDVFPTYQTAIAQWHLARIIALRAAPVDVTAKMLREEALTALTPTTKERPA